MQNVEEKGYLTHSPKNWLTPLALLLVGLVSVITFEAFQQHYYITRFNLAEEEIAVADLVIVHLRRWVVWLLIGIPLTFYALTYPFDRREKSLVQWLSYLCVLFLSFLCCIATITWLELFLSKAVDSSENFTSSFTFFFFQKGPIYLMAYAGLLILLHFFLKTKDLRIKVNQLSALRDTNHSLYEQLKSQSHDDREQFMQVKVGNRTKVVMLNDIRWVEADDYCVKLHTHKHGALVLRSSMKSMEKVLPKSSFIRIHRKFIVNLSDVDEFIFADAAEVKMNDGEKLAVAQSRLKTIREKLNPA